MVVGEAIVGISQFVEHPSLDAAREGFVAALEEGGYTEGENLTLGRIDEMEDDVIFHALEDTDLVVGNDVSYGEGVIAHGGGRVVLAGQPEEPTVIGDGVTLEDEAVVFRSTIGEGASIGERSIVVGTDLPANSVVPDRTVVLNGEVFGAVEW